MGRVWKVYWTAFRLLFNLIYYIIVVTLFNLMNDDEALSPLSLDILSHSEVKLDHPLLCEMIFLRRCSRGRVTSVTLGGGHYRVDQHAPFPIVKERAIRAPLHNRNLLFRCGFSIRRLLRLSLYNSLSLWLCPSFCRKSTQFRKLFHEYVRSCLNGRNIRALHSFT